MLPKRSSQTNFKATVSRPTRSWLGSSACSSLLLILSIAVLPRTTSAAEPLSFHPKAIRVDGAPYVAFPVTEAEALLWVVETRVPQLEDVISKQDRLVVAQQTLIRTSTSAVAVHESLNADQRVLTQHWKEAAEANASSGFWSDFLKQPLLWTAVGILAGYGLHELLHKDSN